MQSRKSQPQINNTYTDNAHVTKVLMMYQVYYDVIKLVFYAVLNF